jgi:hypothetical protein
MSGFSLSALVGWDTAGLGTGWPGTVDGTSAARRLAAALGVIGLLCMASNKLRIINIMKRYNITYSKYNGLLAIHQDAECKTANE